MKRACALIIPSLLLMACGPLPGEAGEHLASAAIPVEVVQTDEGYRLLRGGEPYTVNGAGLEFGDMEALAAHGGNSFRTWRTDNGRMTGQEVLDRAHELGLTVSMCIEIGRERHGFDYDDETAVSAQLEYARQEVLKYKDHPALLTWFIGNEANLRFTNPKVFDAINEISVMIHELDGQHPTTTALAGFNPELAGLIRERAPDLDFISIQMYGDIVNLPKYIEASEWNGPYMVTEWGAIGHWEVGKTTWGAPIEQNSTQKAETYQRAWKTGVGAKPKQLIGSYVFLWGQKQERTPTWYGMFLEDGSETAAIDMVHYIWNGEWPANRSPEVGVLQLDGQRAADSVTLEAGKSYEAAIQASDPDGDSLEWQWEVMHESRSDKDGGDREYVPEIVPGRVTSKAPGEVVLTAPAGPGPYRLFVYVRDGKGNTAHANIPFLVN
ncbi:MAG: hypothetical protein KJN78_09280 [Gammaproteobacteria bacterium]|nr:hypothetical protein [Gammaproteobacteria bacterium]